MPNAKDAAKARLIADVAALQVATGTPGLAEFTEALFARGPAEDLAPYAADVLATQASGAFDRLQTREPGRHRIALIDPPGRDETLVEIVNDDMPFLVDSVMGELAETGCDIRLVLHPTLAVGRDASGRLTSVGASGKAVPGSGLNRESFIQIVIGRIASRTWREALANRLDAVLKDVRQAVLDWRAMLARVDDVIASYRRNPPPIAPDEIDEAIAFLEWLRDDNFIFLGTRDYIRTPTGHSERVAGGMLGVLRNPDLRVLRRGGEGLNETPEMREFLSSPRPLIVTKSNVRSLIHRRVPMDYVGVKLTDQSGQLTGELRIVGLFTSTAYTRSTRTIPYVRHKIDQVLARAGFEPRGHSGKALINVLENLPRDELFQIDNDTLYDVSLQIMNLEERPRVRVLARRDIFDRYISAMVHVPRERYTTSIRGRIGEYLEQAYAGRVAFAQPTFLEGGIARIHFIIAGVGGRPSADVPQDVLEAAVSGILKTWPDQLASAFDSDTGMDGEAMRERFARAFSAAYQEAYGPEVAVRDARLIDRLKEGRAVVIDFHDRPADGDARLGLKLYHRGGPIPLSDRVPVLEHMGLRVIDERTYRVEPASRDAVYLHDMSLQPADGRRLVLDDATDKRLEDVFTAVWEGRAEDDAFNRLVQLTPLDWRQIALLRALAHYLRQVGLTYSMRYVADALVRNAALAAQLVDLFAARFDPAGAEGTRAARADGLQAELLKGLDAVTSLDDDTILRRLINLVGSILRTNYYQHDDAGQLRATLAFKIDSRAITDLPNPKPLREIWVYSPRVEGVHLRFAKVARGGLRWSDRPQDFRTEVLGLVKAQQVKNAVIVPAGAKGGFVPKHLKPGMAREAWLAEGTEAYKIFVSSLLTVTDNLKGETVLPPPEVVRHDGDDPYLVVAADKGTATFSDTANGLSHEAGFWLGDAFASGGSNGYDHKKMGITARGAFEAVKRHFREMDVDALATPITTVGVGDMSGDVFGNGMLLSPTLRLVAAFDHRDIFLDPDPDLAAALAERQRLFALPRSSWADYDASKISAGGGVHSRSAKSIELTPQVRAVLGLTAERMTPVELMRAILKAPVDLLWFGGIGTYIRAGDEADADVGDKANDALRVAAAELHAKVIGEGANLGMTQRGRIEFGLKGGRCNSDAIDNSAGVNCSDVEVNIKIALTGAITADELVPPQRDALLAEMTDDVAELVLANNRSQTLAIGTEWPQGLTELPRQKRLMQRLAVAGKLDRAVEFLPDDGALARREAAGQGLTRSEIGVLLAYAKMSLKEALLAGDVLEDPAFEASFREYFPPRVTEVAARSLSGHRLRREIIATRLANAMIDRGGTTFVSRLMDETGADEAAIARGFSAANALFGFDRMTAAIDDERSMPAKAANTALNRVRAALAEATSWLTRNAGSGPIDATVARFRPVIETLGATLGSALPPAEARARADAAAALQADGVPAAIADDLAGLPGRLALLDVALVQEAGGGKDAAAVSFFKVGDALGLGPLRGAALRAAVVDRYDAQVIERARGLVDDAQRRITGAVLARRDGVDGWVKDHTEGLKRFAATAAEIAAAPHPSASAFAVAAGLLSDLAGR